MKIYRFRFFEFRFRINPLLNEHRSISSWHEILSMCNISVSVESKCIFELFIIDFWYEFQIGIVFCICSKNIVIIYEHRPNFHNIYLSHSKITNQRQMRVYSYRQNLIFNCKTMNAFINCCITYWIKLNQTERNLPPKFNSKHHKFDDSFLSMPNISHVITLYRCLYRD